MGRVSTIGLDLAKNVFQAHGADASGGVVFRKKLRRAASAGIFLGSTAVHGGDGSLRRRSLLGARDRQVRSYRTVDRASLRQTICNLWTGRVSQAEFFKWHSPVRVNLFGFYLERKGSEPSWISARG